MLSSLPTICTLMYIYSGLMLSIVVAYFLPSCLSIIRDLCHLRSPAVNYVLPASKGHGYFWTVPDNSLYHLHLLLEMILVSLTSLSACAVDSAYGFYIYQFASTLRAMTYRLMNPLPTEKFSDTLRMCLMKHQKLLQCRDILERVYGAIILWYIITNTVILCSLIYEVIHIYCIHIFSIHMDTKLMQNSML